MKDMVGALAKQLAANRKAMMSERLQMFTEMGDAERRYIGFHRPLARQLIGMEEACEGQS